MSIPILKWTKLQVGMPNGAIGPILLVLNNQLFAFGGGNVGFTLKYNDIYVFDILADGSLSSPRHIGLLPLLFGQADSSSLISYDGSVGFIPCYKTGTGTFLVAVTSPQKDTLKFNITTMPPILATQLGITAIGNGRILLYTGGSSDIVKARYSSKGDISEYSVQSVALPVADAGFGIICNNSFLLVSSFGSPPNYGSISGDGSISNFTSFAPFSSDVALLGFQFLIGQTIYCMIVYDTDFNVLNYNLALNLDNDGKPKGWSTLPAIPIPGGAGYYATDYKRYFWATSTSSDGDVTFDTSFWVMRIN